MCDCTHADLVAFVDICTVSFYARAYVEGVVRYIVIARRYRRYYTLNPQNLVGRLITLIVTCWPKAPNLAHMYFGSKQNFSEGLPNFKGQGQFKVKGQTALIANFCHFQNNSRHKNVLSFPKLPLMDLRESYLVSKLNFQQPYCVVSQDERFDFDSNDHNIQIR